jgi:hypothetical protein
MMINILVSAQYYENYNTTGEGAPYWKPKGGMDFCFPIDSDLVMYTYKEDLKAALIKMVEEQSDGHSLYEYIDHEVKFFNPIVVEGLEKELQKMELV